MCSSLKTITGPKGLPRLGNVLTLEPDKLHHQCTAWSQKYGPLYEYYVFDQRYLVVTSSTLLRNGFTVFGTSESNLANYLNDRPATFFGSSVFDDKELAFSTACGDNKRLSSLFGVLLYETKELTEKMDKLLVKSLQRTTQILLESDVSIDVTKTLREFLRDYIARMVNSLRSVYSLSEHVYNSPFRRSIFITVFIHLTNQQCSWLTLTCLFYP